MHESGVHGRLDDGNEGMMWHSRRGCCGHPDFQNSLAGDYVICNATQLSAGLLAPFARMALEPSTPVAGVLNAGGGFTA